MFCSKCGSRMPEGVAFCPKCGAIIGQNEQQGTGLQESEKTAFISKNGEMSANEKEEFVRFVDNHIRQTTKFQSAKELLNSKAPMRFAKISFGVPAILGAVLCIVGDLSISEKLVALPLIVLIFGCLFGYLPAYISCTRASMVYASKFVGTYEGKIDIENLLLFLNTHLDYLYPDFHKWNYLQQEGLSIQGAIETKISNMAAEAVKEVNICTEFGEKQWRVAVIWIRPDTTAEDSEKTKYGFSALNRIEGASFISHDMGFAKYKCLVRIAPILQAAMEYYLKKYQK